MENSKNKVLKFTIMSLVFLIILLTKNNLYAAKLSECKVTIPKVSYSYTGNKIEPKVTVKNKSNVTLTKGLHYTVSYSNNTEVTPEYGNVYAVVTVKGKGAYTETINKYFTIKNLDLSMCTVTLSTNTYTYNGSAKIPTVTVKSPDGLTVSSAIYKVKYNNNTNAGTATVSVSPNSSYVKWWNTKYFTINRKGLEYLDSNKVYVSPNTFTFDSLYKTPTVYASNWNGSQYVSLKKDTDFTVKYNSNKDPGTAYAVITGKGNYKGTRTIAFTINKTNINTAIVTLDKNIFTYDGNEKKPTILTIKIKADDGTLKKVDTAYYSVNYKNHIDAGTASLVLTGKGKFTGTMNVNFTINPKHVNTLDISLSKKSYTYNGSEINATVCVLKRYYYPIPLKRNQDYTLTYEDNINPGTASAIVKGKGNYTGTKTLYFTISMPEKTKKILESAQYISSEMAKLGYDYCDTLGPNIGAQTCRTDNSHRFGHDCGLSESTFENDTTRNTCCATYVCWVLRRAGLYNKTVSGAWDLKDRLLALKDNFQKVEGEILAGDILYYPNVHIDIAANDGGTLVYSAGSVEAINNGGPVERTIEPCVIIRVKN